MRLCLAGIAFLAMLDQPVAGQLVGNQVFGPFNFPRQSEPPVRSVPQRHVDLVPRGSGKNFGSRNLKLATFGDPVPFLVDRDSIDLDDQELLDKFWTVFGGQSGLTG